MNTKIRRAFLITVFYVMAFTALPLTVSAAHPTKYKGVDYKRVYNYDYFVKRYPKIKKKYAGDDKKILKYFVTTGMKKQMRGSKNFDVKSYRYGNADLRRLYVYDYAKYYRHYMRTGYKVKARKATATGISKMKNPVTKYKGKDYASEYNYFYYVKTYPAVVKKVGDDDLEILKHYVNVGKQNGKKGKAPTAKYDDGKIKVTISSCKITGSNTVTLTCKVSGAEGITLGAFAQTPYITGIKGLKPASTVKSSSQVKLTIPLNKNNSNSVLQKKFYVGAKKKDGSYRLCSSFAYIQNPQACADRKTAFPKPARGTKKGLKMLIGSDTYIEKARELRCSHVIADFPIEQFLSGSGLSYTYEGRTYQFSSSILSYQNQLRKLRNSGIVVSGVFYLSSKSMTKYMMPNAANGDKSRSIIFGINTKNENRKELEALFSCLADYFTRDGALLANWIFGNESNQYRTYNYCGNQSFYEYVKDYTEQFRLFNTAVKSKWSKARTYICFDHNWNLSFDLAGSFRGKNMLSSISAYLKKHGNIHFDLALHPYPSPEQDPRFWNQSRLVTFSGSSEQYTMLNIHNIAAYVKKKYGNDVHIILPETGYSSVYHGANTEAQQAAAIALSYYLTEFNPKIDMIGIHRDLNDRGEVAGGWSLGIYRYSFSDPKPSAAVFKYMDTASYKKYANPYLKYINNATGWKSLVKNFNGARFK